MGQKPRPAARRPAASRSRRAASPENFIPQVAQLPGLRLRYFRAERPQGLAVLLLHGLASNARLWEPVARRLLEAGLDPIAPDLRGHGETDKPDGDYGFDAYHRDVGALVDLLRLDRPVLVGHSWGALVALAYAGGARGGPKSPAGLVLVDGGIGHLRSAPGATWPAVREALTPPRVDGRPLDELRGWLHQPGRVWIPSAEEEELILANFIVREGRIWPRLTFERHMQIVRAMWDFPLYRAYSNVRCPVVMLPVRPAASAGVRELAHYDVKLRGLEQAARRIRPLHVRWLDETVHDVLLHRPGLVAQEVILFVRSLEPAR